MVKRASFIVVAGIFTTLALAGILSWSGYTFYRLERKQLSEQVQDAIAATAMYVQEENLTLNNLWQSYQDEESREKQAFAIGMNGNLGKMQIFFGTNEKAQDFINSAPSDVPLLNKKVLESMDIEFIPEAVKGIGFFDSLLKDSLQAEGLDIDYTIIEQKQFSQEFSFAGDTTAAGYLYHTKPFILNYYNPQVYRINYNIAHFSVFRRMLPFTIASLLLLIMVPGAFVLYFRGHKLQVQAMQLKENLFSNMTHELKTPLSSLQLIVDAVEKDNDHRMPEEHLEFASSEIKRMKLTVEKILSFGKINDAQFELNKEVIELQEVLSDAANAMSLALSAHNGKISYHCEKGIKIIGDKALLTNVFTTLTDNAIKYNDHKPEITIVVQETWTNVIITVADNGRGIPEEYHKKVFEPFFRIPTGNVHDVKGHGIGLSFVHQVIGLHNGTVAIAENSNGGSIFTIELPH